MDRFLDSEEDMAAPSVPDERANAASKPEYDI